MDHNSVRLNEASNMKFLVFFSIAVGLVIIYKALIYSSENCVKVNDIIVNIE